MDNYGESISEYFYSRRTKNTDDNDPESVICVQKKYVKFSCKYGGIDYQSQSKNIRNSSTYKVGCPAYVIMGLSKDKRNLEIRKMLLDHQYHDHSKAFYDLISQVRRLTVDEKNKVVELLSVRSDKKYLQQYIWQEFGKNVTLKDLTSIQSILRENDDFPMMITCLTKQGASSRLLVDDNKFKALYFSTVDMKNSMSAWPEIVFIDGTYKLTKIELTVMIMMVEDSNTSSEIVAVGLLVNEDYDTFKWFLNTFKNDNITACSHINCFMGDKDLLERNCVKEVFGRDISVFVCLWHAFRTFHREITKVKMDITEDERVASITLIEKMAYSKNENDYDKTYEKFEANAPEPVKIYYNKNWHSIRDEWAFSTMAFSNFGNRTNNRLESLNAKLKQMIKKLSSLVEFIKQFFAFIKSHDHQNKLKTSKSFTRSRAFRYLEDSDENTY